MSRSLRVICQNLAWVGLVSVAVGQSPSGSGASGVDSNNAGGGGVTANANDGRLNASSGGEFAPNAGPLSSNPWFGTPGIRQQLGLTEDQYQAVGRSYDTAYRDYERQIGSLSPQLSPEQRATELNRLNTQFEAGFQKGFEDVVRDQRVSQRYNQLRNQYQGYGLFNDPQIQNRLGLTAQQQAELQRRQSDWDSQLGNLRGTYSTNPELMREQFSQLQAQRDPALRQLLNTHQYQAWQEMTGSPYNFSVDDFPSQNSTRFPVTQPGTGANSLTQPGTGGPASTIAPGTKTTPGAGTQPGPAGGVAPGGTGGVGGTGTSGAAGAGTGGTGGAGGTGGGASGAGGSGT
jgi:hypothetical protein